MSAGFTNPIFFICPKCKQRYTIYKPDMNYCEKCGTELIKKCPKCEEVITSISAEYCKNCGTKYIKDNL